MTWDIPLTEYDADSPAVIEPEAARSTGEIPAHAVICFFHDVIREVSADPAATAVLCEVLDERAVPYVVGKTWTTDAPYRETQAKVAARRREGCITVEMETAAFLAVARRGGPPPPGTTGLRRRLRRGRRRPA